MIIYFVEYCTLLHVLYSILHAQNYEKLHFFSYSIYIFLYLLLLMQKHETTFTMYFMRTALQ